MTMVYLRPSCFMLTSQAASNGPKMADMFTSV